MKLLGDFCTLKQTFDEGTTFESVLSLHPDHPIYRAHFPGNPITPGVCIIQLCKELVEQHEKTSLVLTKITHVKFLSVINPKDCDTIQVKITIISHDETGYKLSAIVYRETTVFTKLSFFVKKAATSL
jgi:3-hydroxyacyl-[acyl-carrier-protein] dehydratase